MPIDTTHHESQEFQRLLLKARLLAYMALHAFSNAQLSLCKNSYISIGIMKHHLLYINLFLFVCLDLNAVVHFITGSQSTAGSIMVSFSSDARYYFSKYLWLTTNTVN